MRSGRCRPSRRAAAGRQETATRSPSAPPTLIPRIEGQHARRRPTVNQICARWGGERPLPLLAGMYEHAIVTGSRPGRGRGPGSRVVTCGQRDDELAQHGGVGEWCHVRGTGQYVQGPLGGRWLAKADIAAGVDTRSSSAAMRVELRAPPETPNHRTTAGKAHHRGPLPFGGFVQYRFHVNTWRSIDRFEAVDENPQPFYRDHPYAVQADGVGPVGGAGTEDPQRRALRGVSGTGDEHVAAARSSQVSTMTSMPARRSRIPSAASGSKTSHAGGAPSSPCRGACARSVLFSSLPDGPSREHRDSLWR